ncbi:MAG TPA: hypothetical protein VGD03_10525 [Frankiaceae bacterium]
MSHPGDPASGGTSGVSERLQQLLHRAVDDQVSEQRALQQLLVDVRTAIDRAASIDDVRAIVSSIVVDELAEIAGADQIAEIRDGLAGARTDLRQLPEQTASVVTGAVARAVNVGLGDVRGPVQRLDEELPGRLQALAEQLDRADVRTTVEQVRDEVRGLSSQLALLLQRTSGIERLREDVRADIGSGVDRLTVSVSSVGDRVGALAERLEALDSLRAETADIADRLDTLDALRGELQAALSRMTGLDGMLTRLQTVDELRTEVGGLDLRLERLANLGVDVAGLRTEVRGLAHPLDEVARSVPLLSDLPGHLGRLDEQLAALPERWGSTADLGRLADQVAAVDARLAAVDVPQLNRRLDDMAQGFDGLAGVSRHLEGLASLPDVVAPLTQLPGMLDHLADVPRAVRELERRAEEIAAARDIDGADGERLAGLAELLAGQVGGLTTDVAALAAGFSALDAQLSSATAGWEPVRAGVGEVQERLSRLDDALAGVRESVERPLDLDVSGVENEVRALRAEVIDRSPLEAGEITALVRETVQETLGGMVRAEVETAVARTLREVGSESERRLAAHVDDAVLALAEALLSRPATPEAAGVPTLPTLPAMPTPPFPPAWAVAPTAAAALADDDADDLDDEFDVTDEFETVGTAEAVDAAADPDDAELADTATAYAALPAAEAPGDAGYAEAGTAYGDGYSEGDQAYETYEELSDEELPAAGDAADEAADAEEADLVGGAGLEGAGLDDPEADGADLPAAGAEPADAPAAAGAPFDALDAVSGAIPVMEQPTPVQLRRRGEGDFSVSPDTGLTGGWWQPPRPGGAAELPVPAAPDPYVSSNGALSGVGELTDLTESIDRVDLTEPHPGDVGEAPAEAVDLDSDAELPSWPAPDAYITGVRKSVPLPASVRGGFEPPRPEAAPRPAETESSPAPERRRRAWWRPSG